MHIRLSMIGAAALSIAAVAAAEPAKPEAQPAKEASRTPELVLASAEQVRTPTPVEQVQPATPPKKRAARVTSCRCGGQESAQR